MKVSLQLVVIVLNAQANFCDDLSRLRQTANGKRQIQVENFWKWIISVLKLSKTILMDKTKVKLPICFVVVINIILLYVDK